jgi:hypothetical protein
MLLQFQVWMRLHTWTKGKSGSRGTVIGEGYIVVLAVSYVFVFLVLVLY